MVQRTRFFGMMRCLGMTRTQIRRYVRLEALNWCRIAIPIGIGPGILATWMLCFGLRTFFGNEFETIPVGRISWIGIGCGTL
ncbi:FtsX-like permease family protein, partial [uncultured Dubosiella sp.]